MLMSDILQVYFSCLALEASPIKHALLAKCRVIKWLMQCPCRPITKKTPMSHIEVCEESVDNSFSTGHHEVSTPNGECSPSGYCSQTGYGHPPTAFLQRSIAVDPGEYPPCLGSSI